MAKKKKIKDGEGIFKKFFGAKKKVRKTRGSSSSLMSVLKVSLLIMFLATVIAGGAIGMYYLDIYVKKNAPSSKDYDISVQEARIPFGFLKRPDWVNQEWKESIYKAAGQKEFKLIEVNNEELKNITQKLEALSWLQNVKAQVTPEYIQISADYLRPLAMVQDKKGKKYYLSNTSEENLNLYSKTMMPVVVLDYIPLLTVPIPEIKGISSLSIPDAGATWEAEDAEAAMGLLYLLNKMDLYYSSKKIITKPLLSEVESIDVSNFAARKSRSAPNIVLNIKDGTQIYWGAAWGQAAVYLEADDQVKLTRLYETFIGYDNSLQVNDKVKFIELRWLENEIPRLK